ncbi:MAG TPA: fumarylacetoacetate hydrolase family protein [Candidatus Saccharimonadales bacterium]|nr:fumarylacetoacetate hydrolase family protein [Candidatus Saccharimonadales bacterium]
MKIIRYEDRRGKIHHAIEQGGGRYHRAEGDLFSAVRATQEVADIGRLLAPVVPTMIWCIGQNYRLHSQEVGMKDPDYPIVFAKGPNAVQHPGEPIVLPRFGRSEEVDYEAELVVIIGKPCKNVVREQALDYVAGYTCGNDVSARDWQLKTGGGQWCRGKTFDTFAPLGPCLVTPETLGDPSGQRIQTTVNGETRQDANTREMIFDVPALIEFLSKSATLLPGTAIFTGTPQGVGMAHTPPKWLRAGDQVSIIIEKIGTLSNPVHNESI